MADEHVPSSDADLKKTPLWEEHGALGARMVPFAGWDMPVQYTGIVDEHRATRTSAGVFDVSHMGEVRVWGFGAFDFLQRVLSNDLHRIDELGAGQYTLLLDEDGGIIDDLIVYHTGDLEYLLIVNAGNREADVAWLQERAPEDLEVVDESDRTGLIALQGPKALDIVEELASDEFSMPPRFHIAAAYLDTVPALVARTGYTGEDGVEIVARASDLPALWRALLSFTEVTPVGLGARDTLRLEMGYPLHGSDIDRTTDPVSAGLGWAVGKDKGDFTGKAAVDRVREVGPTNRLVAMRVADGIPRPGMPVLRDGREVGKVASGTFSPTLSTGIATAWLPAEFAAPGTELQVVARRKTLPALVEKPPFVKDTSLSARPAPTSTGKGE